MMPGKHETMKRKSKRRKQIFLIHALRFKSAISVNEVCFSCFSYTIMICVNALEWNECNVFGEMIVSKEMF